MRSRKQQIKVVKVPRRTRPSNYPQVFPRMPRLYLELIENKSKIQQDLINKEYVPSHSSPVQQSNNFSKPTNVDRHVEKFVDVKPKSRDLDKRLDMLLGDSDEDSPPKRTENKFIGDENRSGNIDELLSDDQMESKLEHKLSGDDSDSDDSQELSSRLEKLLKYDKDDSDSSVSGYASSVESYKKKIPTPDRVSSTPNFNYKSVKRTPPTLAELQQQGGYQPRSELRDINQVMENEFENEDSKREILFKFDLLRKSYPGSNIPEYTIHTDLRTLQRSYDDSVRRLSLDSTVESYKTYLVYGFMGCEFLFGNFLGFDMQGFTQQQIIQMHSYEKLLIELGEKSYVPSGSKWPVELRLLFMIIMNAAFFLVSKMMMKKTGANLMGMINSMNKTKAQPTAPKRKMRGPSLNFNDIPNL